MASMLHHGVQFLDPLPEEHQAALARFLVADLRSASSGQAWEQAKMDEMLAGWFKKEELVSWKDSTWEFAKQIFPLLLAGVFVAGLLMGRPGLDNGLVPNRYVAMLVGGNSIRANLFASLAGALMYFATLTEVPILQGLMGSGMGKGPALALLLAGPALSLPSMIVLNKIMGTQKMLTFVGLVVGMSALAGMAYGALF